MRAHSIYILDTHVYICMYETIYIVCVPICSRRLPPLYGVCPYIYVADYMRLYL